MTRRGLTAMGLFARGARVGRVAASLETALRALQAAQAYAHMTVSSDAQARIGGMVDDVLGVLQQVEEAEDGEWNKLEAKRPWVARKKVKA